MDCTELVKDKEIMKNYGPAVEKTNELVESDGIMVDPDSKSQNYDTWIQKYREGKILYSPWPWVGQSTFNAAENTADGKGFELAAVQDMQIFSFGCWPEGDSKSIIAIGSQAEDPERLADFIG